MVERHDGVVRRVRLTGDDGDVEPACRFLAHVIDSGGSPNTAAAYGYDLKYLFEFLTHRRGDWREFSPALSVEFLGWLRRRPSRRPAQRLALAVATGQGRLLALAVTASGQNARDRSNETS